MQNGVVSILAILIAYHGCLILLGLFASRRTQNNSSFLIGDRALNGWVAGLSYAATSSSAWVLMGFSGFVYAKGLSALWTLLGIWGGYIVAWKVIGPRLNQRARQRQYVTLTDVLADGVYRGHRRAIQWIASFFILFCFIFYIAAQLQAAGVAMNTYFGVTITTGALFGAIVIGIYAVLGGFWAVSLTDTVQGMVMSIIAIVVPIAAVWQAGGPSEILAILQNNYPGHLDLLGGQVGFVALGTAIGLASIGLGTLGQPQLLARIMAVKSDRERRKAFTIAMSWSLVVFSGMAVLGLAGRALTLDIENAEQLLFAVTDHLFPSFFAGLILAALLSAVMSTVDSILVASTAAVSHDMNLYPKHPMLLSRLTLVALMMLSIWLAISTPASIFNRVLFAWTALGATFGPVLIIRLFFPAINAKAIILSMVIGFATSVSFSQFLYAGPGNLFERTIPWLAALAILIFWPRSSAMEPPHEMP
jgi:sodium/proline symporter